jgi:Family of unknown function (DUF6527)
MKVRTTKTGNKIFKCPGCNGCHSLPVTGDKHPRWDFNGDHERPTFKPSILATAKFSDEDGGHEICHSFVTDGQIHFLGDCTHMLKGQTVAIPDWPHEPGTFGGLEE